MKKFLSLVLALVMTMSLVTIGAGATDYKDLTDKDEIQYEEAVAVLNKLGIITGYTDGSFQPTGALTRGAAAKIIVSLMQGADFAGSLTVTAAPYKDVPVDSTFAAVISYCKTAGYINGYNDGTFRPTAPLTGFAFSKMLLGALGYDGAIERFTGTGWTMNVANLSSSAGLLNNVIDFKGNAGVNREVACQLALNTLKATEVQYTGGTNISTSTGDANTNVVVNAVREYKTSNNTKINQNIKKGEVAGATGSNYYTLEFGEEHFQDLKLTAEGSAADDFERPSNKWTYKNVAIGTYAVTPDYVYTTGADGDTDADMVKDMGLKGFDCPAEYYVNGKTVSFTKSSDADRLAELANLTSNGVQIEVYMDTDTADTIDTIVVIYTQMMQVSAVSSSQVTLKKLSDTLRDNGDTVNFESVNSVKDDDDCFKALKDLKVDDYVLVVPVLDSGSAYRVASVAVPQSVTGKLTNIQTKSSDNKVKGITLGGTNYKMSNKWTSEDDNLSSATILSASTDTTAYLDTFGYVIYVKDVKASNSAIIIDRIRSGLVDGTIVKYAEGWNASGEEISINLGDITTFPGGYTEAALQGTVWEYRASTANDADYQLVARGTAVTTGVGDGLVFAPAQRQWIENGKFQADVIPNADTAYASGIKLPMASDVKFLFLSTSSNMAGSDVTGITVREGLTAVGEDKNNDGKYTTATPADTLYGISYILNKDMTKVIAVVVDSDDDAAVTANLIYVQETNEHWIDAEDSNRTKAMFKAYDAQGNLLDDGHSKYAKTALPASTCGFYTYTKTNDVYSLTPYTKTDKATSVNATNGVVVTDKGYFTGNVSVGTAVLNAGGATVVDLDTGDGIIVNSMNDMKQAIADGKAVSFDLRYVYNGSDNAGANTVSLVFVLKTNTTGNVAYSLTAPTGLSFFSNAACTTAAASAKAGDIVYAKLAPNYLVSTSNFTLTSVSAGVYSFVMPARNVVAGDFTVVSALYSSVVDPTLTGAANLKLDTASVSSAGELTMNAVDGESMTTQIKETMAALGYVDVTLSKTGTVYTLEGTKDGVVETVTCDTSSDVTLYNKITVDTAGMYVLPSAMLSALGAAGNVKMVSNGVVSGIKAASLAATTSTNKAEYTSNAYTLVTYTDQTSLTTTSAGTYDITASAGAGCVVAGTGEWFLAEDGVLTLTVTPTAAVASGTDTITFAASTGTAITPSVATLTFVNGDGTTAKTVTYTGVAVNATTAAIAAVVVPTHVA